MRAATWMGHPVWVVGTSPPADTTSSQFWVDVERKVVLRMIMSISAGRDPLDVHLDDYVQAGGGMLATKVSMFVNGAPVQIEDYADWRTDVPLSDAIFNVSSWVVAP